MVEMIKGTNFQLTKQLQEVNCILMWCLQVPVRNVEKSILEKALSTPVVSVASPSAIRWVFYWDCFMLFSFG